VFYSERTKALAADCPAITFVHVTGVVNLLAARSQACEWSRRRVVCKVAHCNSRLSIPTRCGLESPGFGFLVALRDFLYNDNVQTCSGVHPGSFALGTGVPSRAQNLGAWNWLLTHIRCRG